MFEKPLPLIDSLSLQLRKANGSSAGGFVDAFHMTGRVELSVFGPDGMLKDERHVNNLVVTAGKNAVASLLQSVTIGSVLTVNGAVSSSGLIKLAFSSSHGLQSGQDLFVYNVGGTTEANGFWVVTVVDSTHVTLNGSTFSNAFSSNGSAVKGPAEFSWMGVGTGSSGPTSGDTALGSEITTGLSNTRVSITRTNPSANQIQYSATWNPGQATNGAITEAGIFNDFDTTSLPSGTMLARATFSAIAKGSGDTLTINWTITVS